MYRLEISRASHRQIARLPASTQQRINAALAALAVEPRPRGAKKLTGLEGYRLRVGDLRVLYVVDDAAQRVVVYRVMARSDVYRRR